MCFHIDGQHKEKFANRTKGPEEATSDA